jgi:putative PIG3 family NAD(P)H quinone oxidoreductase
MKVVAFTGAGGNEVVEVQDRPEPRPGPHEVLVEVTVAGLNPADLHQRRGHYPAPAGVVADVPGLDVAGHVVGLGDRTHRWKPGDRVFGLAAGGGLAERVAVDEGCLAAVPASLDDEAAAAVPEATITAHDALVTQGVFRAGESVLVQGASGAVGSAAVQIAVALGGRVFAVTRSEEAADAVRAFGAEALDEASFELETLALTDGGGVDVVLELVGASHLAGDLAAIAMRGRIVILSVATGWRAELDLRRLMRRRATLRGTVLRARSIDDKAEAVAAFERDVVPMLADGRVRPAIDEVFPVEEIHRAFDRLAQTGKRGKVLVRFG